ncbi:MAG: hypothetical protein WAS27_01050 [Candidatus Saccharimonadales bacterium]
MDTSLSLSSIGKPFAHFLANYHATIFFTVIGLLLAGAIFSLSMSVQNSEAPAQTTETISASFDQETAAKIKQLRSSSESSRDLVFPAPRNSPFVE